jgi:Flp pilus assembly protein TadG
MATLTGKLLRRLVRSESGAELIEFALTLPLLLLIVLGIIESGFILQEYEVVTNAAREGARIAVLSTYAATQPARVNNTLARVNQYLAAGGLTTLAINCGLGTGVCTGVATPTPLPLPGIGCVSTVSVRVAYPHPVTFLGGIITYFGGTFGNITLRSTSQMRTEASAGPCP